MDQPQGKLVAYRTSLIPRLSLCDGKLGRASLIPRLSPCVCCKQQKALGRANFVPRLSPQTLGMRLRQGLGLSTSIIVHYIIQCMLIPKWTWETDLVSP